MEGQPMRAPTAPAMSRACQREFLGCLPGAQAGVLRCHLCRVHFLPNFVQRGLNFPR